MGFPSVNGCTFTVAAMITSVVNAILPVALLIAFGFVLGKRGVLDEAAMAGLAKLVVSIALPVALFLDAIATSRSELSNVRYVLAIAIALAGLYVVTFAIGRGLLGNDKRESAVEALSVGLPSMAFVGLPVLVGRVGVVSGTLPVLVGNIVTSITLVPVTVALLESRGAAEGRGGASARRILVGAVKPPLVWLPVLGLLLTIADLNHLPIVAQSTLRPLGQAASGVALVTVGLMMSHQKAAFDRNIAVNVVLKLVAMPLAMFGLVIALSIRGQARTALLLLAMTPTATTAGILALRYRTYMSEAAPTIFMTTILSFVGYTVILALA